VRATPSSLNCRQTEISNFDCEILGQEDVIGLHIPMNYVLCMKVTVKDIQYSVVNDASPKTCAPKDSLRDENKSKETGLRIVNELVVRWVH